MAKANQTGTGQITINPRELDFVSRFTNNFQALREILGITRPIRKEPGSTLRVLRASVALQPSVGEGEEIPYSQATVVQLPIAEATIDKYSKGVTLEAIKTYGYDVAVERTDNAFLSELEGKVSDGLYTALKTGELTSIQPTFQMALAMARGLVLNRFKSLRLETTEVVGFVNILDFYQYIGAADITVQTAFGLNYIRDFMGYRTVFLASDTEIARGTIIATPVENLVAYYVDPSESDFARAGLEFTTWGETPFLGFHTEGNYKTMVSESYAIMGISLFFEYINGVAVVNIEASGSMAALTASTAAGANAGESVVTISTAPVAGGAFYFAAASGTAPAAPSYLADFDPTGWTPVANGDTVTTTNGYKYTIVEVNGSGQAIGTATGTVVAGT